MIDIPTGRRDGMIMLAGEIMHALPDRALWWPTAKTLLVADVHLGKETAFRALGQPFPDGASSDALAALSGLLGTWRAERLIILGDFVHSAAGLTPDVNRGVAAWLRQHSSVDIVLIEGNHDHHARRSTTLPITPRGSDILLAPSLIARHEPVSDRRSRQPGQAIIAGHLHPAVILTGRGGDRLRTPCFLVRAGQLILPAFGSNVGHMSFTLARAKREGSQVGVPVGDGVRWL